MADSSTRAVHRPRPDALAGDLLRTRETAEGDFELSIDRLTLPTH